MQHHIGGIAASMPRGGNLAKTSLLKYELALTPPAITTCLTLYAKADGLKLVVGPDYGFLLPSGMKITYDPSQVPMKRIVKIETDNGEELQAEKVYKVALNDFIASGGDGYTLLRDFKGRTKMELLVRDALIRYIEETKTINERPEKRINNIKLTEEYLN